MITFHPCFKCFQSHKKISLYLATDYCICMICYEQNCPTKLNWIFCLLRHNTSISTRCCRIQNGIKLKISFREWLHAWLRPRFKLSKIQLVESNGGGGVMTGNGTPLLWIVNLKKKISMLIWRRFFIYNENTNFK